MEVVAVAEVVAAVVVARPSPAGTFDIGTMICANSFDGAHQPLGAGCT